MRTALLFTPFAALQHQTRGATQMFARFNTALDRTALTIFLTVAAVPVLAFPLLAVALGGAIH
jgi:hypothetical protein